MTDEPTPEEMPDAMPDAMRETTTAATVLDAQGTRAVPAPEAGEGDARPQHVPAPGDRPDRAADPGAEAQRSAGPGAQEEEQSLFQAPPMAEQERMVEAILFATAEPVTAAEIAARMPHGCDAIEALHHLRRRYEGRGVRVVRVGDAWAMRTAPDLGYLMQRETTETRKLSRAAIETLAIIAYHQPVTRAEIEEIRGVSVSRGTIDLLLELDWIRFGRRRMTPGRPVTFVVTQAFLDHFGLESARDLPGLKELRAAGLLDNRPPPGSVPGPADLAGDGDTGERGAEGGEEAEDADDQDELFG